MASKQVREFVIPPVTLTHQDLAWIAEKLIEVDNLYTYFDLTALEWTVINKNNPRDYASIKRDVLLCWWKKKGAGATLANLVSVLATPENVDVNVIEEITQHFKHKFIGTQIEQSVLKSLNKARQDGCTIKVRYGKVLFCGASAAGKTNFLNLLMKKDFEIKHKSTELAKPQQVSIAIKALISSNENEIQFQKMDIDEEIEQLMSYLPKKYTEQAAEPHHVDSQSTITEQRHSFSENSFTAAEHIISSKLASKLITKQAGEGIWNVLTFMDTGGQPQFISMLPTVNSFAMITFIVHKMTGGKKSLENKVMVQHGNQQGEQSFQPHPCECTYIQLIKMLMTYASSVLLPDVKFLQEFREVHCKNTKNTSNISIIGTHSADVSADDTKIIDEALADMIDNADCKNVTPNLNEEYDYLVPVDNKDQNKSDSDTVIDIKKYTNPSIIRKHIYDFQMQQDVYSVPIQWLLLELEIRKVCNDKECCFITYKDVLNLATEKNLGDEDFIKNGLRFHHLFGVLLYFENVEGIRELVITNHQWLFEKLTEIVLYSFKCTDKGVRDELRKGIFNDAMLKKLKIEEDFKNANIDTKLINPKKSFLNLLKHLKIVVPLDEDETKYFMPSILKSHPLTDLELEKAIPGKNNFKHQSNENAEAEPFLFQLQSTSVNLIPRGFFCFLVVELMHSTGWQPYKKNQYDNLVTFFKVEGLYFVTIIDKIFFLEVHITHHVGNANPIHYEVLKIMHNTMVEVKKNLNICCIIKHGFLCKKCSDTEQQHLTYLQITHVDEDGIKCASPSDSMVCDCINENLTPIESSHQIWLQKNENLQGIKSQEQNMSDTNHMHDGEKNDGIPNKKTKVKQKYEESSDNNVDYHRLLWQELNKEFGTASTIFVMKVGTPIPSYEYAINYGHSELADYNTFVLVDPTMACATNYSQKSSISSMWKRLAENQEKVKQLLEENARSVNKHDSGHCLNYYYVSMKPAEWYQWFDPLHLETGYQMWKEINVDSKNDDCKQAALYKKLGGTVTKYHSLNKHSGVKISFKVRAVQINRPWLDLSILENTNYTIDGEKPQNWSTGELNADNKGWFPLLSTQMIVAKDITVTASTEMEQSAINDACSLFSVGSDSYKTINNNSIKMEGTQVIGYVCTVVPKFPR